MSSSSSNPRRRTTARTTRVATRISVVKPIRLDKPLRSLPLKERRKVVAQDIVVRFERGQLVPKQGTYVQVDTAVSTNDLQTILKDSRTQCSVCAIGGAICATAGFEDKIKISETDCWVTYSSPSPFDETGDGYVYSQLNSLLGRAFLDLIEDAFEGYHGDDGKGYVFFGLFTTAEERFLAIWKQVAEYGDFRYRRVPGFKEALKARDGMYLY